MNTLMQDSVPGADSYRRFLPFVFVTGIAFFFPGLAICFGGLGFLVFGETFADTAFADPAFAAGALGAGCGTGAGGAITAVAAFPFFLPATGDTAAG